jgi:DNA polymerase-4
MDTERKIIHVDLDAFFASVEQRDHPELRGKPVAVGFDGERGVVSTASYEARKFGVHSAQSIQIAKRLCPQLVIVPCHFNVYKMVSQQIHEIFLDYTDMMEPLSLDEAFLDVTHNKKNIELAVDIAKEIKKRISEELHLTASAGVSYCKFLAKVASDYRKPDGLCVIHPEKAQEFIDGLKIEQFWGVGEKTAHKMHFMGISMGKDLRACSRSHLMQEFGKAGAVFYDFARGIDNRPVVTDYVRKSVGCEHTFETDINHQSAVTIELYHTVLELIERLNKSNFQGRTLTLKIKFDDFQQISRSISRNENLTTKNQILPLAKQLLKQIDYAHHAIRLMGLSVSNPADESFSQRPEYIELELEFEDWPDE